MPYWDEDPAYHRGCGGRVTVKRHDATWSEWDGGSPAETTVTCGVCGDIGDGEVSESPQEPCGVCGQVLTDHGCTCRRCESAEEEEGAESAESGAVGGIGTGGHAAAVTVR